MDTQVTRESHRPFRSAGTLFRDVGANGVGALALGHATIAIVLDDDGTILDIAFRSPDLALYGVANWIGRRFIDTVTDESRPKVGEMFEELGRSTPTRKRQINHTGQSLEDYPVDYTLHRVEGLKGALALGEDLRQQVELQQQLINTQVDLERRNNEINEKAIRYRSFFQTTREAVVIVRGADGRIADINPAGAALFGATGTASQRKLMNEPFQALFAPSDRANISDAIAAARHTGNGRSLSAMTTEDASITIELQPFREQGSVNLIATLTVGGTDQPRTRILGRFDPEGLPEACVVVNPSGRITAANDAFVDLVGAVSKTQVVDRDLSSWFGASSVDLSVLMSKLKETGAVKRFASVINDARGEVHSVVVSAHAFGEGREQRISILILNHERNESHFRVQPSGEITSSNDFAELIGRVPLKELIRDAADIIERMCIEAALRQTGNNRASAADLLGLSRQSLYLKLRRHGLEDFRPTGNSE